MKCLAGRDIKGPFSLRYTVDPTVQELCILLFLKFGIQAQNDCLENNEYIN